jgi:hypothetical protein
MPPSRLPFPYEYLRGRLRRAPKSKILRTVPTRLAVAGAACLGEAEKQSGQ